VVESSTFERLLVLMISRFIFTLYGVLFIWFFLTESGGARAQSVVFDAVPASVTGIDFDNEFILPDSIDPNGFLYQWNGGGVAVGDINKDGLSDLFFTGNKVKNRLYLNKGELKFQDATSMLPIQNDDGGWSSGVAIADVNDDGWLDIYICRSQIGLVACRNLLFINQNGQSFTEEAEYYGLDIKDNCTQATFFDADQDGDLDMFLATYPQQGAQYDVYQDTYSGKSSRLFVNSNNHYSLLKNIKSRQGFGLGVLSADFTNDNITDLYVTNDLLSVDNYFIGPVVQLRDRLSQHFGHVSFNSMGVDAGDVNNDGWLDLVTLDMLPESAERQHMQSYLSSDYQKMLERGGHFIQYARNMLHLNKGKGFAEVGQQFGVDKTDWSWGPLLFDMDNDGFLDLFVSTSLKKDFMNKDLSMFVLDTLTRFNKPEQKIKVYQEIMYGLPEYRLPNKLFHGNSKAFVDASHLLWAGKKVNSTGCAVGDFDNDGDLDIVVNNLDTTSFIYRNNCVDEKLGGHYLRIRLENETGTPVLNAKVLSYLKEEKRVHEVFNVRGFQSSSEAIIHIGIPRNQKLDSIQVIWPMGQGQTLISLPIDTTLVLHPGKKKRLNTYGPTRKWLKEEFRLLPGRPAHKENSSNDFKKDPILHRKLSNTGPGVAVGDVNGDNLNDVYLCAAKGSVGMLMLSSESGEFYPAPLQPWQEMSNYEESSALIVDVDSDSDNDLIIISGGYEHNSNSPWYWDRVYLNNGKGFFHLSDGLPKIANSKSCVTACDYDMDGDFDLFIGERFLPNGYPTPAGGHILKNENGTFIKVTDKIAPELFEIGMITSSLWTDYDNDGDSDLLIVGEWMPVVVMENNNGKFVRKDLKRDKETPTGWWNVLKGADVDNDGDMDYIVGNAGSNLPMQPNQQQPCKLYYPKLNYDNRPDPILTYWLGNEERPFAKRDKMLEQVSTFRKKFISYKDYSTAPIDSIVGLYAPFLAATELQSVLLLNLGNGEFDWKVLPAELQRFPICDVDWFDINDDGFLDLIAVGNDHAYSNQLGDQNSGGLSLAIGTGDGSFEVVDYQDIGFNSYQNVKTVCRIDNIGESPVWIVGTNNGKWRYFSLNKALNNREKPESEIDVSSIRKVEDYLGGSGSSVNRINQ
jgi:hypothetical protein